MQAFLDQHYHHRNNHEDFSTPDPLVVLRRYVGHEYFEAIALVCALFAYGKASLIVEFLSKLDFDLLAHSESHIRKQDFPYYRFQTSSDVCELFCILSRIIQEGGLKKIALEGYGREGIFGAINACIHRLSPSQNLTRGLRFLISTPIKNQNHTSALKRWNLFFRWLVRKDNIDFGIWHEIRTSDLILPLDTHSFSVCQRLGFLQRKNPDLKAAILVTQALKNFDSNDPVKYDFALYRIGQEKVAF